MLDFQAVPGLGSCACVRVTIRARKSYGLRVKFFSLILKELQIILGAPLDF